MTVLENNLPFAPLCIPQLGVDIPFVVGGVRLKITELHKCVDIVYALATQGVIAPTGMARTVSPSCRRRSRRRRRRRRGGYAAVGTGAATAGVGLHISISRRDDRSIENRTRRNNATRCYDTS